MVFSDVGVDAGAGGVVGGAAAGGAGGGAAAGAGGCGGSGGGCGGGVGGYVFATEGRQLRSVSDNSNRPTDLPTCYYIWVRLGLFGVQARFLRNSQKNHVNRPNVN